MNDALIDRRVLGRYRVLRQLAVGGMGVIYLGRGEGAAGFAKPVVIKRIEPSYMALDHEAEAYFVNEAKILARMRHPGIVSVIDFGRESDGGYAMVLEYVHGFTLTQWRDFHRKKDERFPADEAIFLVRRILETLEYAHTRRAPDGTPRGIIHRDVTPSNVLIDVDGHIKLADFGIASIRTNEEKSSQGTVRGKLPYLAPELFLGEGASVKSDVYSAALVLHELLVGTNEFRGSTNAITAARVATLVPTRVSAERGDTAPSLDDVLAAALAKNPAHRYPSAEALAEDLRLVQRAPDAEIERSLKQRIRADFEGALPAILGIEPLAARAAALQRSPRSEDPPTSAPRGRRLARALLAAAVIAAVLTIGGAAAFALFIAPRGATGARYVVVERAAPTTTLAPPPAVIPSPPAPDEPARAKRSALAAGRLTRAFASHRRAIQACYESHTVELSGTPRVEIQFRIDRAGDVEAVALAPANLATTALGECILGVARAVRFGPQERPLRFSIPVTATVARR